MTRFFFECALTGSLIECHTTAFGKATLEPEYAVTVWVFDEDQTTDFEALEVMGSIEREVLHVLNYHHPKDGLMIR
jgi:hypothetical protein